MGISEVMYEVVNKHFIGESTLAKNIYNHGEPVAVQLRFKELKAAYETVNTLGKLDIIGILDSSKKSFWTYSLFKDKDFIGEMTPKEIKENHSMYLI